MDCSSRRKFSGKKVIPFEVLPFSGFYRNDRNFLHHLFGLPVEGFKSREREKNLPVFCKWYNSIPFLFSLPKKKPVGKVQLPCSFRAVFLNALSLLYMSESGTG